ncbi:conserved Plasmodium protein, unknown function [Plasmodium ovale]|nr:conserved Plasmodium protein, unknown function [Plasmodium ovale]
MTSSYINEVRKRQKEYLSCLLGKFQEYSSEKFLTSLINKSLNEIALYPFQDVNENEVINDINKFINELSINAEYKKKIIFRHLCEVFLSDKFFIYDEKDRYDLKYVILKLLFLIGDNKRISNSKEIDSLYDKYISNKKNEQVNKIVLNLNEKKALDDINNFNIEEEKKYINEFHQSDDEDTRFTSSSQEEYEKGEYNELIEKEKREKYGELDHVNIGNENYRNKQNSCSEDSDVSNFYETKYSVYVEDYMKSRNELTYENVIRKISNCVYKYPHYGNIKNRVGGISNYFSGRQKANYNNDNVENEEYGTGEYTDEMNYHNSKTKYEENEWKKQHLYDSSNVASDEDIFISLKNRQKKNKDALFMSRPKEQYFFNNINMFDEEIYDHIDKDPSIIYETDIYNLHNVFTMGGDVEREGQAEEEGVELEGKTVIGHTGTWRTGAGHENGRVSRKSGEFRMRKANDSNISLEIEHKIDVIDNALNGNSSRYDKLMVRENNRASSILRGKNVAKTRRNKRKKKTFYVSEIFIVKEILMILSLNCPIKYGDNFFTNFLDFLFNKVMDKNKIKDDFLFFIQIKKKMKKNKKGQHSEMNSEIVKYHAVVNEMMNVKLYNTRRGAFKNYIKIVKKTSIKLFYIHIFFFLVNKFRSFFFFLPCKLSNLFNYIIYIKENFKYEEGKRNFFFLSHQMCMNESVSGSMHMNSSNVRVGSGVRTGTSDVTHANNNAVSSNNVYYQGNFLECFLGSLKSIYDEWVNIVEFLYNYHTLLVLRQYNIVPVKDEQLWEFLQRVNGIKVMNFLKVDNFVNWKKKRKRKRRDGKREKEKSKFIKCGSCSTNEYLGLDNISSFRSLSLIHLHFVINKYLYVWDILYDFVDYIFSYLLHNISISDYIHFNANYDNAKKFCICYDMILLYWRNNQIVYNKSMEKIFRFFLNDLNIYYSRHIHNWIKKGKTDDDKFNEFFVYSEKKCRENEFADNMLFVKKQNDFVLCPEFFNSFVFFLISLGNNIRLYMKINSEKDTTDYVDYYLWEEAEGERCSLSSTSRGMPCVSPNNVTPNNVTPNNGYAYPHGYWHPYHKENLWEDKTKGNFLTHGYHAPVMRRLHENTLNYYYNMENVKKIQNCSLDIISKFLRISKNKKEGLPYFNKNIMTLNISYDLFIKKFLHEQFFNFYQKSNNIFLYSLMKYCYLWEYFCCLRSLVFLEISDFISPFFEYIFKEVSIPIIDEKDLNFTFRQCIVHNTSRLHQRGSNENGDAENYSCSSFLHKKFILIHMKILLSKDDSYHNYDKKEYENFLLNYEKGGKENMEMQKYHSYVDNASKMKTTEGKISQTNRNKIADVNVPFTHGYGNNHESSLPGEEEISHMESMKISITPVDNRDEKDDTFAKKHYWENNAEEQLSHFVNKRREKKKDVLLVNGRVQYPNKHHLGGNASLEKAEESTIYEELTSSFYKEEIIANILKRFYFSLKENKIYNNNINVINYRNLIIDIKGAPFINFLFDGKCLEKYSAIFSFFLEIKKSLHVLNLVHIFYKYIKGKSEAISGLPLDDFHIITCALCILKYKIYFFLNTLYTYYQWVLSFSWSNFVLNLYRAKSLYHIKINHEMYLNFVVEAMLVPIITEHQELYNLYISNDDKKNHLYKKYEEKFFNCAVNKKKCSKGNSSAYTSEKDANLPHDRYGKNAALRNPSSQESMFNRTGDRNIHTDNATHEAHRYAHFDYDNYNHVACSSPTNSLKKQFLLNELFSNNIINLLFIPSQIYEILQKISKHLNFNFDLNFDNSYDDPFGYKEKREEDEVEEDELEEDEEEIKEVKKNIINAPRDAKRVHTRNDMEDAKFAEKEQLIFSIKNDIKMLSHVFEIHYSEFMMKLNVISVNVEDNSFFGPNKNSLLFNHIIRLDKNVLKKVSILEYMLSFQSFNNDSNSVAYCSH